MYSVLIDAFFIAACAAISAISVVVKFFNFPPYVPNGVRLAPTIKIS